MFGTQKQEKTRWNAARSDGLNLEMQADHREDETLQILNQVVEATEPVGIAAVVDIDQRAYLRRGERDVLVAENDLQLLSTVTILRWPSNDTTRHRYTCSLHLTYQAASSSFITSDSLTMRLSSSMTVWLM